MDKVEGESTKGRIVLATVKGDVHDIGKNLVDIILTNNGYEVHNLGIKVNVSEMVDKAVEVKADAIGMSGLLVKSTLIMRENLEELNTRGLAEIPVDDTWSDMFSKILVEHVEPKLGQERMTLLYEYPSPEAAFARVCADDARVAERFELYGAA